MALGLGSREARAVRVTRREWAWSASWSASSRWDSIAASASCSADDVDSANGLMFNGTSIVSLASMAQWLDGSIGDSALERGQLPNRPGLRSLCALPSCRRRRRCCACEPARMCLRPACDNEYHLAGLPLQTQKRLRPLTHALVCWLAGLGRVDRPLVGREQGRPEAGSWQSQGGCRAVDRICGRAMHRAAKSPISCRHMRSWARRSTSTSRLVTARTTAATQRSPPLIPIHTVRRPHTPCNASAVAGPSKSICARDTKRPSCLAGVSWMSWDVLEAVFLSWTHALFLVCLSSFSRHFRVPNPPGAGSRRC